MLEAQRRSEGPSSPVHDMSFEAIACLCAAVPMNPSSMATNACCMAVTHAGEPPTMGVASDAATTSL